MTCRLPIRRGLVPVLAAVVLTSGCLGFGDGDQPTSEAGLPPLILGTPSSAAGSASPGATGSPTASGSVASPSGSASGTLTPTATGSPRPSLAAPKLPAVSGYAYAAAPKAVVTAFTSAAVPEGVLGPPTVKSVQRNKTPIGSVAARTLNPDQADDTELQDSLLTGLVEGMGDSDYTLRTRMVTGGKVVVAFRKGSTILAWVHDGLVFQMVSSKDEATTIAYPTAMFAG